MSKVKQCVLAIVAALFAVPAAADRVEEYVQANLLSILYHELGHAIIDVARLPVFGQEEDAADVASILLIDQLFDEESAVAIAYDSAFGFLAEADLTGEDVPYWDTHGPDLQRYYNLVCLFVGADLTEREDIAADLGLPEERLDTCEEEFELANDSWGPIFDELAADAPGTSMRYIGSDATFTDQVISEEVAQLNLDFVLPEKVDVVVESCGEANAFYDLDAREIIMCTELETFLRRQAEGQ